MSDSRVIAFTGGGTGGHIYPGLAVIEELRKGFSGRIVWLGSKKASDRRIVEEAGVEYIALPSGKLRRQLSLENLADAFRVAAGYFAARRLLAELEPLILFSKGGYVSVPPCAAAASLGIPVFTHESDLTPGLATRLNARRAERVLLAYEETRPLLPEPARKAALLVGNPLRASIRAAAALPEAAAAAGRAFLGAPEGLPILLVLGGSQGARQINELVAQALPELRRRVFVVHQTGEVAPQENQAPAAAQAPAARSAAGSADSAPAGNYRPFAYIREEMPLVLAAADLVLGRAGAGTLWEAASLGKPLILVPLAGSGTRGDQVDNARLFEAAGAARVLLGKEVRAERLLEELDRLLGEASSREAASRAAHSLTAIDGAAKAAALILERIGAKP